MVYMDFGGVMEGRLVQRVQSTWAIQGRNDHVTQCATGISHQHSCGWSKQCNLMRYLQISDTAASHPIPLLPLVIENACYVKLLATLCSNHMVLADRQIRQVFTDYVDYFFGMKWLQTSTEHCCCQTRMLQSQFHQECSKNRRSRRCQTDQGNIK